MSLIFYDHILRLNQIQGDCSSLSIINTMSKQIWGDQELNVISKCFLMHFLSKYKKEMAFRDLKKKKNKIKSNPMTNYWRQPCWRKNKRYYVFG